MAERAHPDEPGFQDTWFKKSPYRKNLFQRYRFCNQYIKHKEVVDIPCGVGWGTSLLKGYQSILGLDISSEAIEYANKHYRGRNRRFMVGDMESLPLSDNSTDVVVCLEGFEHVPKACGEKFLAESKRVLRDQGLIIMTSPVLNEAGLGSGNPYHLYEYPEKELITLLNNNFRFLKLERVPGPDLPLIYFVGINVK